MPLCHIVTFNCRRFKMTTPKRGSVILPGLLSPRVSPSPPFARVSGRRSKEWKRGGQESKLCTTWKMKRGHQHNIHHLDAVTVRAGGVNNPVVYSYSNIAQFCFCFVFYQTKQMLSNILSTIVMWEWEVGFCLQSFLVSLDEMRFEW